MTRITAVVLASLIVGCEFQSAADNASPSDSEPLARGEFDSPGEAYPAADGSLYVIESNGDLWCVRAAEAVKVRKVEQFSEPKSQAGVATPAGWLFAMQYYLAKRASEAAFIEGYDMALSEPPYDDDQDSDYFDPVR